MADETLFTDILTRLRPGYKVGGVVTTPKRGFVDEPGSYAGKEKPFLMQDPKLADKMKETKRAKFRATPVGERLQWIADNGKNYNKPKDFVKGYEYSKIILRGCRRSRIYYRRKWRW